MRSTSARPGPTAATTPSTRPTSTLGEVTNDASARAFGPLGNGSIDTDDATGTASTTVDVPQVIALALDKSSLDTSYDAISDVLTYSYVLTNTGNVTLSAPFTITDDRSTNAACPDLPDSLAPGASIACGGTYGITQDDLDTGAVTNHATGEAAFGAILVTSNEDSVTIEAVQSALLGLTKVADESTYDDPDDVLHYTYNLSNDGNVTLNAPTVSDDNSDSPPEYLAGDGDDDGMLDVEETWTFTASYDVTQEDIDGGSVTNNATGHAEFTFYGDLDPTAIESDPASVTVEATQTPALTLTKTPVQTEYDQVGQKIDYVYVLTNSGNVTLLGAAVADSNTDALPAYFSGDLDGDGKLDVGEVWTFKAQHTVNIVDIFANTIVNVASGHATFDGNPVVSNIETKSVGNTAADLGITKSDSPDPVRVNDPLTYTIVVTNYGPNTATSVIVTDTLPSGTTYVSASTTQGSCNTTVICNLGNLARTASATITIVVTPTAATSTLSNTATVSATQKDHVPANNSASTTTTVNLRPTTVTYSGATSGDYHDPATMAGTLIDTATGAYVVGATVTFTLSGGGSCSGLTNSVGFATCSLVPNGVPGPYTVSTSYAGGDVYAASSDSDPFLVTKEETTTEYTGASGPILLGSTQTLSGVLREDDGTPIAGRILTLRLGPQSCTDDTDASGYASCTITVTQPLGPTTASATFAGDAYYLPSSDSESALIYANAPGGGGSFVIGNQSQTGTVYFWGSQWANKNSLSGGAAPDAFKGFAKQPGQPSCGVSWTTGPGNSAPPPAGPLPEYMAVAVTNKATKSGSAITGTTIAVVIVRTNAGYSSNPGHIGTGTVVARICG